MATIWRPGFGLLPTLLMLHVATRLTPQRLWTTASTGNRGYRCQCKSIADTCQGTRSGSGMYSIFVVFVLIGARGAGEVFAIGPKHRPATAGTSETTPPKDDANRHECHGDGYKDNAQDNYFHTLT